MPACIETMQYYDFDIYQYEMNENNKKDLMTQESNKADICKMCLNYNLNNNENI